MKKVLSPKELQALKRNYVEEKGELTVRHIGNNIIMMVDNPIIFA